MACFQSSGDTVRSVPEMRARLFVILYVASLRFLLQFLLPRECAVWLMRLLGPRGKAARNDSPNDWRPGLLISAAKATGRTTGPALPPDPPRNKTAEPTLRPPAAEN
ncbi:hypothetical protein MRX96_001369 [Rhipicephalus microplus]